ncbi:hypothetical protein OS493_019282 [Desmophyllum pertusum]|uniref:G-protein coupled receptors family 1 profile domain-containing protein n=1 Tax=Desmophyllum pertusum TaxID=174260 RepID=A0A9X0CEP8_9CNID|nr:hypothetical protein OS493_019282 [Desmophyllum pertusum]
MSLLNKYPCANITAPTSLSFSSASFSILSAVVATVGNLLVVLAVLLDPHKDLRTFTVQLLRSQSCVGRSHYWSFHLSAWCHTLYLRRTETDKPGIESLVPYDRRFISLLGTTNSVSVLANTAIAVTFAVLIFTNVKIFKYLREQVHQWDNFHDSTEENAVKKQAIKWEKKITKTLFIALMLFLACYLPSCVCIYIINFCFTCNCVFIHWVKDIQWALVVANSSVNPFVYAWRN